MNDSSAVVRLNAVDIIFGDDPKRALAMLDEGADRAAIQSATAQVVGVSDCTLDINTGETLVLMGLSGSGKSTLLRAINALNPVARGTVEVRATGDDAWINPHTDGNATLRRLRLNTVSMVFQQFALLPWRSVAENVGLGLELAGVERSVIRKRVDEQLALVGLSDWANKRVQALSGGMQQRVGLARAFATHAPILLMDEPYSALDPLIRTRLQDELLDLQRRLQRTIVFVSHDLDEAIKIGSRIAIMEGGRIVQCGTPKEILQRPANDYVADFVAHMNPLAVLTAEDAMRAITDEETIVTGGHRIDARAPLREVMRVRFSTERALYVESDGAIVGVIDTDDLHKALLRE
ncbi:MAG: choline ABC transporter ATP-binding protein [Pseudomonadota bacterium]